MKFIFTIIENGRQHLGGINKNENNTRKSENDKFDKLIDIGNIGPELKTLKWWISRSMLILLVLLIPRLG